MALFWLILRLLGVDVRGWLDQLWDEITVVAIVLVCVVLGWAGGKQIVPQSYADAKAKTAETKEDHKRERLEKKESRRMARAEKRQHGGKHDE